MQLLLRRKAKSVPDSDWQGLLDLQSHLDGFHSSQTKNEEGLTTWQTIELMSQAASSYSGTRESMHIVQSITARVLVNTHTLTTPTFDPLGLCLSPQSALLNHSCIPNAIIIFSGPMLILRSVAPIAVNTELLISYIDTTNSSSTRRAELQDRYFFTCTCEACSSNTANGFPDSGQDKVFQKIEARAIAMQAEAAKLPAENAAHVLKSALDVLQPYPPHRQPYPSILHTVFLNAITSQSWPTALNYTLKAYFFIDPVHHPLNWHPVRIVRKWVLLRLVVQIAGLVSENDDSVKAMENFGIDWQIVAVGLYREIADGVIFSHGRESPFADQVKALGEGTGIVGASVGRKRVTEEWGTLRKVADQTTP
ncbi:hypothetical protein MMC28_000125 [Mycoblastus sanguinarius]|nr:hypothetical protein [Mycoblastus sanguinarius]